MRPGVRLMQPEWHEVHAVLIFQQDGGPVGCAHHSLEIAVFVVDFFAWKGIST